MVRKAFGGGSWLLFRNCADILGGPLVLDSNGLLPLGRHQVTVEQFREHFVDAFPTSKTRGRLFTRWQRHRESLSSVLPVRAQWIDGSFVTGKEDPGDIDLVSFVDGETFDGLAPALRDIAASLLSGKATKAVWMMDSFPVFEFPSGHPLEAIMAAESAKWHKFWQSSKHEDGLVKGYLEVMM